GGKSPASMNRRVCVTSKSGPTKPRPSPPVTENSNALNATPVRSSGSKSSSSPSSSSSSPLSSAVALHSSPGRKRTSQRGGWGIGAGGAFPASSHETSTSSGR